MNFFNKICLAIVPFAISACANEEFVCGAEPQQTVLQSDKPADGAELVKIYNSKKVLIRCDKKLLIASPGQQFRNVRDGKIENITLDTVDVDSGKVVVSGLVIVFAMRSTSDHHPIAQTIVRSSN